MSSYTDYIESSSDPVAGDVLQVKEATYHATGAHISRVNANVLTLSGMSITITPRYADSKIYGILNFPMSSGYGSCTMMYRAGSDITDGYLYDVSADVNTDNYHGLMYHSAGFGQWFPTECSFIDDTHNTTGSLTYTPHVRAWTSYTTTGYWTHQGNQALFTLYEIKS